MLGKKFRRVPAVLAGFGLILVMALVGCKDVAPDIGWTASANNTTDTTAINFRFNAPVTKLSEGNITITSASIGENVVMIGALTGSGTTWTLNVTPTGDMNVWVSINEDGISSRPVSVQLGQSVASGTIGFSVFNNVSGIDGTTTTSENAGQLANEANLDDGTQVIHLTFDLPIYGLTMDHITIVPSTNVGNTNATAGGIVTKKELTGSGKNWLLEVDVVEPGNIAVGVNMLGISSQLKTLNITNSATFTYDAEAGRIRIFLDKVIPDFKQEYIKMDQSGVLEVTGFRGSGRLYWLDVNARKEGSVDIWLDIPGSAAYYARTTISNVERITYTLNYNREEGKLEFTFNRSVSSLDASQINVTSSSFVTKGAVSGGGKFWSMPITFSPALANVDVQINHPLINSDSNNSTTTATTWSVDATNDTNGRTVALRFTINATMLGLNLSANNITIVDGTGSVTPNWDQQTKAGNYFNLPVTVTRAGTISVNINAPELTPTAATSLTVGIGTATWTATLNQPTTGGFPNGITLAFSRPVELLDSDITLLPLDGTTTAKGVLSGSGRTYSLALSNQSTGRVQITINKDGIATSSSNNSHVVTINETFNNTFTLTANSTTNTTTLYLTFRDAITLGANDLTLSNAPTNSTIGTPAAVPGTGNKVWSVSIMVPQQNYNQTTTVYITVNKGNQSSMQTVTVYRPSL